MREPSDTALRLNPTKSRVAQWGSPAGRHATVIPKDPFRSNRWIDA
jgi:hypothetical protein